MSEENVNVCEYYHKGICLAQGQYPFPVGCTGAGYIGDVNPCKFAKNPVFDSVTELQHDMLWIYEQLFRVRDINLSSRAQIGGRIEALKEKMRFIRNDKT